MMNPMQPPMPPAPPGAMRRTRNPCKYDELLACLRVWIDGCKVRGADGSPVVVPLTMLIVNHEAQNDLIKREVFAGEEPDDIGAELDEKIEMTCKHRSHGVPQVLEIVGKFFDGVHSPHEERVTILYHAPPASPAYGQVGFAGMHRDMGSPQNQNALLAKTYIEATDRARIAQDAAHNIIITTNKEQGVIIKRYQEMHLGIVELQQDLMNQKEEREEKRALAKWKLSALDTVLKKATAIGPMLAVQVSRALTTWINAKRGRLQQDPTPRQTRAMNILQKLIEGAEKSGAAKDPDALRMILGTMGVDEKTCDDVIDLATEFTVEALERAAQTEAAKDLRDLTGIGDLTKFLPAEAGEDGKG